MSTTTQPKCYDCGRARHRGTRCVPLAEPAAGTSYRLEVYGSDSTGILGSYGVDIVGPDGLVVVGALSSRADCERLLTIRGFKGPFVWPTLAESNAARAERRKAFLRRKG